jgi:hypothetical protein
VSESPVELPTAGQLAFESATLFASLAFGRLAEGNRDLDEARLAIEALKVLLAVVPKERRQDLQSVLANLQLAYADAASTAE